MTPTLNTLNVIPCHFQKGSMLQHIYNTKVRSCVWLQGEDGLSATRDIHQGGEVDRLVWPHAASGGG